jgi:hypothetical protein
VVAAPSREEVPQHLLFVDFAHGVAGQGINKFYPLWHLHAAIRINM